MHVEGLPVVVRVVPITSRTLSRNSFHWPRSFVRLANHLVELLEREVERPQSASSQLAGMITAVLRTCVGRCPSTRAPNAIPTRRAAAHAPRTTYRNKQAACAFSVGSAVERQSRRKSDLLRDFLSSVASTRLIEAAWHRELIAASSRRGSGWRNPSLRQGGSPLTSVALDAGRCPQYPGGAWFNPIAEHLGKTVLGTGYRSGHGCSPRGPARRSTSSWASSDS